MRWARLTDANPPNTTECTAPIRAQASMVNTASGTIGMYSSTRSPRPTPSSLSMAAAALTSSYTSCRVYVRSCSTSVDTQISAGWSA
ncbi:hypothetical protein D3C87_1231450 [compost metagenome]